MAVMGVLETDAQKAAVGVIELRWRLTAACEELLGVEQIAYGKRGKDVKVGTEGDQKATKQLLETLQDQLDNALAESNRQRCQIQLWPQQEVGKPSTGKADVDVPIAEDDITDLDQALPKLKALVSTSISRLDSSAVGKAHQQEVSTAAGKRDLVVSALFFIVVALTDVISRSLVRPRPVFTREIHSIIAGFHAGDNAYQTLAHYSATDRKSALFDASGGV
ncbi:hypothetical protein QFC20_002679 [Naganishia adeliensis]|uniref:Uncharacterized protein n=1 Tax=Naganishia adeliensis TaxID=92952 RepID=A0ACC2WIK8_9TREE|nr:hypothetical protein QFC20_002679 [Naganishia adeliensis]